ncbi:MAG TPA: DGQHR domain-containing protein [Chthoniobacterales bacterium]|jgi:DGQHR domain-containing protein
MKIRKLKVRKQPVVVVSQNQRTFFLTMLNARDLVQISYASVRNRDAEEGAVQRILNPRRIDSIKDFTVKGGDYPNCIILNWVDSKKKLGFTKGKITVPIGDRLAQIIDGQHRVEGIRAAIKAKAVIGRLEIPVAFYQNLTTTECADIFLSINTEQKPVQRSLVFDLYDVASAHVVDPAAVRARDIASQLNDLESSPFKDLVRLPNVDVSRKKGSKTSTGVDLSTVVTSLKPLVEEKGIFEQVGVGELEMQTSALINFFDVLRDWYGGLWPDKDNVFLTAAGFSGAIDFFKNKLVFYCKSKGSFEMVTIQQAMDLDPEAFILRSHLKGLQGRHALRAVSDMLVERFNPSTKGLAKLKF